MVSDTSECQPNQFDKKWVATVPNAERASYSDDSEESFDSDYYESQGKSYSDDSEETESGESFENDYESPEDEYPLEPLFDTISDVSEGCSEQQQQQEEEIDDTVAQPLSCTASDVAVEESDIRQQSASPSSRPKTRPRSEKESRESHLARNKDEAELPKRTETRSETASSKEEENSIRNQRRRVQWANPELLNWSFHEGFVDNASRKRRQLKRWNSSDDLEASTSGKRRHGRRDRGSSRKNNSSDKRQDYPVRDPPGHHIESPSIKTKILSAKVVSISNEKSSSTPPAPPLHTTLPVVVEDNADAMLSENELERTSDDAIPIQPHRRASCENLTKGPSIAVNRTKVTRVNDARPANMPIRCASSEAIPINRHEAPPRRTKSSDGAATPTPNNSPNRVPLSSHTVGAGSIQTLNSSGGSSEGSRRNKAAPCLRAPATARRILACSKSKDGFKTNPEWRSFEKMNTWVTNEKENPTLNISNAKTIPKLPAPKRMPGQLSSSLHYVGPRTGDVAMDSSKSYSQSMHVHTAANTNELIHEDRKKRENNTLDDLDADESIRSTEVSSDSPSFALQVSQSSFSSFQSEESATVKVHRNRPATSAIMASATLIVNVSQARGLISLERNLFGKMKPAEPFVELYLGGKACGKTGVARRSNNHIWKDSEILCEIGGDMARELSKTSEKLELRIYDRNNRKENFMGAIMFVLPKDDITCWYPVEARSEHEADLCCAGASGSVEIKVQMISKFYPVLTPEHVFVLRQHSKIALDLSWSLGLFLETSCVATDLDDGLVLWDESVYFANRTNPNRSIVFPNRLETPGQPTIDTLVFDLDNIPRKVGALCLILTAREGSLSDLESFEVRCKDAVTGQGIGRFVPRLKAFDTSVVLLRMNRAKNSKTWDLDVMAKGYRGFREFGSMLPEIQAIAQGEGAYTSRLAERTALMRAGDTIRIQDYVAALPDTLSTGLFWKVANGESALPLALILDKDSQLLDVIHRMNSQSADHSVKYAEDRFQVCLNDAAADIHYICFSLGPYLGEQADHILTAAFNILNSADGTELVRSTVPDFDRFPTRTVTIGCFYRTLDSWAFALLGIPSSDLTIDDCTRTLQHYLIEKPLDHPSPLPLEE